MEAGGRNYAQGKWPFHPCVIPRLRAPLPPSVPSLFVIRYSLFINFHCACDFCPSGDPAMGVPSGKGREATAKPSRYASVFRGLNIPNPVG